MFVVPAVCPGARLRFADTPTLGPARRPTLGRVPSTPRAGTTKIREHPAGHDFFLGPAGCSCARSYAMRNISHSMRCTYAAVRHQSSLLCVAYPIPSEKSSIFSMIRWMLSSRFVFASSPKSLNMHAITHEANPMNKHSHLPTP